MTVGDDELVAELERARGFRRVMIAAALGDSTGTTGPEALRSLMQETGGLTSTPRATTSARPLCWRVIRARSTTPICSGDSHMHVGPFRAPERSVRM